MAPHDVLKFLPLDFGNALLSGFFQALFDRILPHSLPRIIVSERELVSDLDKWRTKLAIIQSVLGDAEEKQWTNMAVKVWLDDLRDFAYNLEDMLDEYNTTILQRRLTEESPDIITITIEELKKLRENFNGMSASGAMSDRLEELCGRIRLLELMQRTVGGTLSTAAWQRPPSTCVPTNPAVYGRDEDKSRILEMMSSGGDANFRVISIVGMAGVGKTTLAQMVYNDSGPTDFYRKAWVCISNDFDIFRISMAILESLTHSSYDLKNLNEVQVQLKIAASKSRFLLVLDDAWSKNYDLWETLKAPFVTGAPAGSRIIVTTRSLDIALTVGGPSDYYDLKLLSDEDCWSVFTEHLSEDIGTRSNLEAVREKVVAKCGGLPLAARTLGGLLRSKGRNSEWEDILNSKIWDLPEESNILPVLKLSYYHLPSHLKRCLAHCAILPKNYEFEEKELVLLWMAEGIILPSTNNKQLEDIGSEYFHDLLSRSIFQKSSGDTCKFVMHNLVNDLAQWISGETVFKLEADEYSEVNIQSTRFRRARHSSYIGNDFDGKEKFEVLEKVESLRTFLPVLTQNRDCFITETILLTLPQHFKKLRVLSLRGYRISELSNDSINGLRYLRYLNLSHTEIQFLPESISSLYNLQILLLRNCLLLLELPPSVISLINLHHLDISGSCSITGMPCGMDKLEYLQTLSNFIVSRNINSGYSGLKELKNMKFLRGELCISPMENVTNFQELREGVLIDKKNLRVLILEWGSEFGNSSSRNEGVEKHVLDMFRPHANLTNLTIKHYGGIEFPYWVGDPSFSNMVFLRLEGCKNCRSLPPLGLLRSLKDLIITGLTSLRRISRTFYGDQGCLTPFQSLETLYLENLEGLEVWDNNEHVKIFHRLRELSIINCPLLSRSLPEHLPSLQKLVIRKCTALVVSFSSFPKLCELEIDDIRGMGNTTAADSWSQLHSTAPLANNNSEEGQHSFSHAIWRVEHLIVKSCPRFSSFLEVFFLSNLSALEIQACGGLTSLQTVMNHSRCLGRLKIQSCNSLEFIVKGQLPFSLKRLEIHNCENLLSVLALDAVGDGTGSSQNTNNHIINASLFEHLCISGCRHLTTLASGGQLPETLKHLEIIDCMELNTLSEGHQLLPASLELLEIKNSGIRSIPIGLQNAGSLREIEISYCSNLVSFPQGGLPFTNLRKFSVSYCRNLVDLPSSMHGFNSLQELHVFKCSSNIAFPLRGLPINLTSLKIEGCRDLYDSLVNWGFHRLTSLRKLDISGCSNNVSFPPVGMMLPTSLNDLSLASFSNLKSLYPEGFQNLVSLEYFTISDCRNLKTFPDKGLPSSLLKLEIIPCSLQLRRSCITVNGERRSNIANIPFVKIDGEFIK
ncbi:hypothetical protein ACOSQ3_033616 [Xanthoceras sorbifolium]